MSKSTLLSGLDGVSQWRKERAGFFDGKENEFTLREKAIHEQMEALNAKLGAVQEERQEIQMQREALPKEQRERSRQAILNGLKGDSNLVSERDVFYRELIREREERVANLMESPSMAKKVKEFEQFQETQSQFATLPESYRSVILKHHEVVRSELKPIFKAFGEPLRTIEESSGKVGIIATVDPAEGPPEALAITLPIPFSVYTNLNEEEGLHHLLAYRCSALVSGMLLRVGIPSAPVLFDEYNGMISIRVYLRDHKVVGDLKTALQMELERIEKKASELKAVQLGIEVAWVDLDVLMGEE